MQQEEAARVPGRQAAPSPLSARELNLVRLVARGCTNAEIAAWARDTGLVGQE
ncbi:hypothetical protein [Streptomyces sp. CA-179760]|uniref:hypothetical protein n=1 Tax=Streptomyces sp. CA-179760 TaxID=3240054 RepID=UPI003D8E5BCC